MLAWLAAGTSTIKLGSAIFQMPGRTPAMTAMTAATIDELSGGRMLLGIGSSGPQVAEGWHGQRFGRQLQRTREYVAVVRKALARERLEFHGETLELPLPDGPGQGAEADDRAPCRSGSRSTWRRSAPSNTALAGEIADGWIPTFFSPEHVAEFRALLQEGADRAGRSLDGFDIAPTVQTYVSDDRDAGAQPDAPDAGALHRRHGLAQAELLQQPRPALRLRGRRARGPGPLPGRARRPRPARRSPTS